MVILTDLASESTSVAVASEESLKSIWSHLSSLTFMGVVKILALIVVLLILIHLINKLFERMLKKSRIDKTAHGFLKAIVRVGCWFVAALIVAGSLDIDISSLIALLSVIGLALSLAIQGALSNIAGGIVILVVRPFRVGDYILVGKDEGYVHEINMTYTILNTYDHRIVSIPNSTVTSSNVVNYSVEGRRRVEITVCVDYRTDIDAAKQAFTKAILAVPQLKDTEEIFTRISAYKDNGVEYTLRAWCKNEDYWDAYFGLIESVKRAMDEDGVEMTYTNYNIHLVQ